MHTHTKLVFYSDEAKRSKRQPCSQAKSNAVAAQRLQRHPAGRGALLCKPGMLTVGLGV